MSNHSRDEPSTAPKTDQWYDLVLGPSAKDDSSHKFCTLRCEFRLLLPFRDFGLISIDKLVGSFFLMIVKKSFNQIGVL